MFCCHPALLKTYCTDVTNNSTAGTLDISFVAFSTFRTFDILDGLSEWNFQRNFFETSAAVSTAFSKETYDSSCKSF